MPATSFPEFRTSLGGGVPLTNFTILGAFEGSPDFLPKQQVPMQYQYNDTFSMVLGRQTFKVGASLYLPMRNLFQDEPGTRGDLTFTGVFTCQHSAPSQCVSTAPACLPTPTACSATRKAISSPMCFRRSASLDGLGLL